MKCSIQLGFASLNRTFHLSPHENICTIALITIHYLYTIQLGFASLDRALYLSPHENIWTIARIKDIHYVYTIHCPVFTDPPLSSRTPSDLACITDIYNEQHCMKLGISFFCIPIHPFLSQSKIVFLFLPFKTVYIVLVIKPI